MKKKTLFIILGIVLVLALVLLVLWLCMPEKTPLNESEPDATYPCTVTQQGKNLLVTIQGGEEDYEWAVTDYGNGTVTAVAENSGKNETRFLVKPLMTGSSRLTLSLRSTKSLSDVRSRISLDVAVKGDTVSYVGQSHTDIAAVNGDEKVPCSARMMSDGTCLVTAVGQPDAQWDFVVVRGKAVGVRCDTQPTGTNDSANGSSLVQYKVTCKGTENVLIFVMDTAHGEAMQLEMKYDGQAGFSPLSYEWITLPTAAENTTSTQVKEEE